MPERAPQKRVARLPNPLFTPAMLRALRELQSLETAFHADPEADPPEIVCEGRECWLDERRVARGTVNKLLRLCLLSVETIDGRFERYEPNEETFRVLADPGYVPAILKALRTGKAQVV